MGRNRPNIILIVNDSWRWDKVGTSPYGEPLTPAMNRMMEQSAYFEQAITPANWTLPSHSSVFTGLPAHAHGMIRGSRRQMPRLPESIDTLAETLRDQGYRTMALSNNPWVGALSGLDRGFEYYLESTLMLRGQWKRNEAPWLVRLSNAAKPIMDTFRTASQYAPFRHRMSSISTQTITRWIERVGVVDPDRPFFIFANYMDVHGPYFPTRRNLRDIGSPKLHGNTVAINYANYRNIRKKEDYTPEMMLDVHAYCDACLRNFDDEMAKLVRFMKNKGLEENTLFAIFSDHGKVLGEFPRNDTICFTREIMTRVPLLIRYPGLFDGGRRCGAEVNIVDLYPTIRKAAGVPPQDGEAPFCRALDEALNTEDAERINFSMTIWPWADGSPDPKEEFYIARNRSFKLVESPRHGFLFYDISADPKESRAIEEHPEKARFVAALQAWKAYKCSSANSGGDSEAMPDNVADQLSALGYI